MIQISAKLVEELDVYIKNGIVQNNEGEIGEWYGSEITEKVNLQDILENINKLPNGDYKLTITFEKQ
jgi:hypothetical protein